MTQNKSNLNNVALNQVEAFADQIRADRSKARRTQIIEGEWLTQGGGPQFRSKIGFEGGSTVFEVDNPTFMGGGGKLPGPMHYCFFGLASCYTGMFATVASMMDIPLTRLTVKVEADVNFERAFALGDSPTMEEVRVTLNVVSPAPAGRIREAEELALQRCPVVFTLRNSIKLTPRIEISLAN